MPDRRQAEVPAPLPGRRSAYAHVTGFYSLIYGATGIEQAENDFLAGSDSRLFTRRLSDLLTGRDPRGGNVVLTARPGRPRRRRWPGSATGAARSSRWTRGPVPSWRMASTPVVRPEPDRPAHDPKTIRAAYGKLADDPDDPLLNRAINQRYPPGSTFKVVVAAAALANGRTPGQRDRLPAPLPAAAVDQGAANFGDAPCSGDQGHRSSRR